MLMKEKETELKEKSEILLKKLEESKNMESIKIYLLEKYNGIYK